jgi:microcystin-dependent protein
MTGALDPEPTLDPFIAQIVMFGGTFAPRGWALCDGQLLSISSYSALFSILGTTYGGDGRSTFGLPDLRGRVAIHPGTGSGLSTYSLGQTGGAEQTTLTTANLPAHSHALNLVAGPGQYVDGTGRTLAGFGRVVNNRGSWSASAADAQASSSSISNTGSNSAFDRLQPYQCVQFIIAVEGTYPSRS